MARKKFGTSCKRPIENYEHMFKKRLNNPPVGPVSPQTDTNKYKKKYSYGPHLDPQLVSES
ncbi:MAG: hypothetical protein P8182_16325 [Deltaproteobacteria bacterium]